MWTSFASIHGIGHRIGDCLYYTFFNSAGYDVIIVNCSHIEYGVTY